ncbi:hypothetical protein [Lysinibacillus fusiformis]|uniref:hypothetical protein n=1 Tax=Lysinibacillus fusiformis TaxID=28031 RepID=UPI0018828334|nr:hypothetical protein [Lysinibacillus fusiformis]MBD8522301.1 hypothetical protein [Lysinibacillus fusiformis]
MKNIKKIVAGLLNKASDATTNYELALERKQEELVQLQLQGEQIKLKDYHKLALLQQVSEQTYEEQKQVVASMTDKIQSIQLEMKQIELYKTEDVEAVIAEIQANKAEINKAQQVEIQAITEGIAEAKRDYLQKLSELGKQYDSAIHEEGLLQSFLVDLGKQPNVYLPYKMEILGVGATVSVHEVENNL